MADDALMSGPGVAVLAVSVTLVFCDLRDSRKQELLIL
jgi:hypothetical protein